MAKLKIFVELVEQAFRHRYKTLIDCTPTLSDIMAFIIQVSSACGSAVSFLSCMFQYTADRLLIVVQARRH